MHVLEHLGELRRRLIYCAAAVLLFSIISYAFSAGVFEILTSSFREAFPADSLIGTGPAEALFLKFKMAAFCGVLISLPVLFYQIWAFVAPGLYPQERNCVLPFVGSSVLLFALGAAFCYIAVFPLVFSFFQSEYSSIAVRPQIRVSEHLAFVMQALLAFGAIFELPILAFLLARAGVVSHSSLIRYWRHAVIVIFVVAAVLTPPDVITQCIMAGPLLLLYGISILVAKAAYRGRGSETGDSQA